MISLRERGIAWVRQGEGIAPCLICKRKVRTGEKDENSKESEKSFRRAGGGADIRLFERGSHQCPCAGGRWKCVYLCDPSLLCPSGDRSDRGFRRRGVLCHRTGNGGGRSLYDRDPGSDRQRRILPDDPSEPDELHVGTQLLGAECGRFRVVQPGSRRDRERDR